MTSDAARFVGSIPDHYDECLVPVIFIDYAEDLARRAAALRPACVGRQQMSRARCKQVSVDC
jgi:hypothetical protein